MLICNCRVAFYPSFLRVSKRQSQELPPAVTSDSWPRLSPAVSRANDSRSFICRDIVFASLFPRYNSLPPNPNRSFSFLSLSVRLSTFAANQIGTVIVIIRTCRLRKLLTSSDKRYNAIRYDLHSLTCTQKLTGIFPDRTV